jgi:acetate kinase
VRGAAENIGAAGARFWARDASGVEVERAEAGGGRSLNSHDEAVEAVFALLERTGQPAAQAVGHRVVHGGATYAAPVVIDPRVLHDLRELIPLAPLHQPHALAVIGAVTARDPHLPQVACFDTAVHRRMPEVAQRFPLPRRLWDEGLRRYGFHGLSYEFLLDAHPELTRGRTVIAHLGHGASLAAFRDGCAVDTTMGFTPSGGCMMGTRSGDLDPGILIDLLERHGYGAAELDRLVNHESGLRGVSGSTSNMQALLDAAATDAHAAQAVEMFCYQVRKHIGALAAALGGLNHLVFTAGIGERAAVVRAEVCRHLGHLGIQLDAERNAVHERIISRADGLCRTYVLATDEEAMIARHTLRIVPA